MRHRGNLRIVSELSQMNTIESRPALMTKARDENDQAYHTSVLPTYIDF